MTRKFPILFSPERAPYLLYGLGILNIGLAFINFSFLISTIQFFAAGFCMGTGIGLHMTAETRRQTKAFWHDAKFFAEKSKEVAEEMAKAKKKIETHE